MLDCSHSAKVEGQILFFSFAEIMHGPKKKKVFNNYNRIK